MGILKRPKPLKLEGEPGYMTIADLIYSTEYKMAVRIKPPKAPKGLPELSYVEMPEWARIFSR